MKSTKNSGGVNKDVASLEKTNLTIYPEEERDEGFMTIELYSWWILLVGVYLSFLSVKSVTGDFEESRMDILFSTPLSRKEYLI